MLSSGQTTQNDIKNNPKLPNNPNYTKLKEADILAHECGKNLVNGNMPNAYTAT
jgi:hypothetical protein